MVLLVKVKIIIIRVGRIFLLFVNVVFVVKNVILLKIKKLILMRVLENVRIVSVMRLKVLFKDVSKVFNVYLFVVIKVVWNFMILYFIKEKLMEVGF